MPIFYDPETGEYYRSNGNVVVPAKRMGGLKSGGDPMDMGEDPEEEDGYHEMPDGTEMADAEMPKKKGKAPAKKGK